MKKLLLVLLAGIMAFGILAVAQEPVTITFLHAMKPTHAEIIDELIVKFQEENPNITVVSEYGGYYSDVEQKLNAAVVAGNPPTVAQAYENVITPLVDVIEPYENYLTEAEFNDIIPGLRDAATVNGVMYSAPFNKSIMILYYRKDLVPTPPTTWEEYLALAEELTVDLDGDGNIDRWGTVLRTKNPENFLNYLHQAGGTLLNEDWTAPTVNDAKGLQAMEYLAALAEFAVIGGEYENAALSADATCMWVATSAGVAYNVTAAETIGTELGFALAPSGPVNDGTMIQGTNLFVMQQGQTQAQIEAGIAFIKFLLRADNMAYWSVESNYLPSTFSAYAHEIWKDSVVADPAKQVMADAMAVGFGPLNHPAYSDFRYHMMTRYEEVLLKASTPQQAVDDLAQDFLQYL